MQPSDFSKGKADQLIKTLDDLLRVMGMRLTVTRDEARLQTPREQDQVAVHA